MTEVKTETFKFKQHLDADIKKWREVNKNLILVMHAPWLYDTLHDLSKKASLENITRFYDEVSFYQSTIMPIKFLLDKVYDLDKLGLSFPQTNDELHELRRQSFTKFKFSHDLDGDNNLYTLLQECMAVIKRKKLISGFAYMYEKLTDDKIKNRQHIIPTLILRDCLFKFLARRYPDDFAFYEIDSEYYVYNPANSASVTRKNLMQLGYVNMENLYGYNLSVFLGYTLASTQWHFIETSIVGEYLKLVKSEEKSLASAVKNFYGKQKIDFDEPFDETNPYWLYYFTSMAGKIYESGEEKANLKQIEQEYEEAEKYINDLIKTMNNDIKILS